GDNRPYTVPEGTSFTKEGKNFVTTDSVRLGRGYVLNDGSCVTDRLGDDGVKNVDVIAAEAGGSSNIDEGNYVSSIAGINAYGSDMKGGTDNIVKIVSQSDIDTARQSLDKKTSEGAVDD